MDARSWSDWRSPFILLPHDAGELPGGDPGGAKATATVASGPFSDSLRDAQAATRQLEELAERVRERREQQRSLATAAGFGVLGGVLLWLLLIELLPWGAGSWLAAAARWQPVEHCSRVDAGRRSVGVGPHGAAVKGVPAQSCE